MELSLSKLPWYGQIGAFVVVSAGAVFGFWHFYVAEIEAEMATRQAQLAVLQADVQKGAAAARRLPEFEAQVDELEERLQSLRQVLPEEKDVADILRRIQGLATRANLTIQRFQPGKPVQQKMYAEIPYRLAAEGTYHNLAEFFDEIGKFPRLINVSDISIKARPVPEPGRTITAECVATTFVLQEAAAAPGKPGGVPKQPSLNR
jgi:type IV pilus assembly protein PilO